MKTRIRIQDIPGARGYAGETVYVRALADSATIATLASAVLVATAKPRR